jgi:hypothetical protein
MPSKNEQSAGNDPNQHSSICPSCLSKRVRLVPGGDSADSFMGCDDCGHVWVGKDFAQDDQERQPSVFDKEE